MSPPRTRQRYVHLAVGATSAAKTHASAGKDVYNPYGQPEQREDAEMRYVSPNAVRWEGAELLEIAEASAGIGAWDVDLATGMVRARPQFFRLVGLDPVTERVPIDVVRALRHPDDRANVIEGF